MEQYKDLYKSLTENMETDSGSEAPTSEGLEYELTDDGTAYSVVKIMEPHKNKIGHVLIPAFYNGKPVKRIGRRAFSSARAKRITISEGITEIGNGAFSRCPALSCVIIPDSVTNIGWGVFSHCSALEMIQVGENNTAYTSIEGSLYTKDKTTILRYASELYGVELTLPSSVNKIDVGAFSDTITLKSVVLSQGVTSIGFNAFCNCGMLEKITIPSSVKRIEGYVFQGCTSLKEITFEQPDGWVKKGRFLSRKIPSELLSDPQKAAELLKNKYLKRGIRRK